MFTASSPSPEPNHDQWLTLSLSIIPPPQPETQPEPKPEPELQPLLLLPPPPLLIPMHALDFPSQDQDPPGSGQSQTRQLSRKRKRLSSGETEAIEPPFPWATTSRATVHSLNHLLAHNIRTISGTGKCKRCLGECEIEFDLEDKFRQVAGFILKNDSKMHNRAPVKWMNPKLIDCKNCGEKECVKPVISKNKESINWLFLFLGQMIGCCTIQDLKYFCNQNFNFTTAAKNRLVYWTYFGLFKQLQGLKVPSNISA